MAENTKVLQTLNNTINTNTEKLAQLKKEKQNVESQADGQAQGDQENQKEMLLDLRDEASEKQRRLEELQRALQTKTKEEQRVEDQIRERDNIIRDLEKQLGGAGATRGRQIAPSETKSFRSNNTSNMPSEQDEEVDELMSYSTRGLSFPVTKLG